LGVKKYIATHIETDNELQFGRTWENIKYANVWYRQLRLNKFTIKKEAEAAAYCNSQTHQISITILSQIPGILIIKQRR